MSKFNFIVEGDKIFYNENHDNLLNILEEPTTIDKVQHALYTFLILTYPVNFLSKKHVIIKNECAEFKESNGFFLTTDSNLYNTCIDNNNYFNKFLKKEGAFFYPEGYDLSSNTCQDCGKIDYTNSLIIASDDSIFCSSACAISNGYHRCDICDEWHYEGRFHDIKGKRICDDCYKDGYICDQCGEYIKEIQSLDINNLHFCDEICAGDYGLFRCERCDDWCRDEEAFYDEETDRYYCEYCYNIVQSENIDNYLTSDNPEIRFFGGKGKQKFGIELEKEFHERYGTKDFIYDFKQESNLTELFWLKSDASLRDSGIEIVSHPCSLEYFRKQVKLDKIFKLLCDNGENSTDNCGLHIHFSRKYLFPYQEINLTLFVNKFDNELISIANRYTSRYAEYHHGLTEDLTNDFTMLTPDYMVEKYSRYQALNWHNEKHGEVRIFYSTNNSRELLAYLELTQAMIEYCEYTQVQYLIDSKFSDFVKFVRLNGDKFINLVNMLNDKGF